jgi:hypothetical protein
MDHTRRGTGHVTRLTEQRIQQSHKVGHEEEGIPLMDQTTQK